MYTEQSTVNEIEAAFAKSYAEARPLARKCVHDRGYMARMEQINVVLTDPGGYAGDILDTFFADSDEDAEFYVDDEMLRVWAATARARGCEGYTIEGRFDVVSKHNPEDYDPTDVVAFVGIKLTQEPT